MQGMATLLPWIAGALLIAVILQLLRIAWGDARRLKIRNVDVLVLTALALGLSASRAGHAILPDLAAGAMLFLLGLVFWLLRMMGAGDAKLYFPLGVVIGWGGLAFYALALIPASLLLWLSVRLGPAILPEGALRARLAHFASTRRYPYAVPMIAAALVALALRGA